MSLPNRNNAYDFEPFLEWRRHCDYYVDDEFFQKLVKYHTGELFPEIDRSAREFSQKVSFKWRDLAERVSWLENRPYLMHYDGHHNRIDRIVRPREVEVMEKEVFGEGLFASKTHPWMKLVKMYLLYQNGEAGVACPVTCTEGLVALLDQLADTPETREILAHCREGVDGDFGIGAQYLSEIQGGSDVPANLLEAVRDGETWRLYGTKFFCSAVHADYAAVTAKPRGSEKVAVFVMPSWLPGDKVKEKRNHFTIDRLKWKMGTSELPTAELTLNGAVAYPLGPLDRGLANVVGIVLTYSRLTVGLSGAATMMRAWREAAQYAHYRSAFGLPIDHFPMVAGQLQKLEKYAKRTTAGTFKVYGEMLGLSGGLSVKPIMDEPEAQRRKRFNVRELIMLQKITTSFDSPDMIRLAISLYGGHGVMEDFSSMPRLYRDSAVNELWEGPRNVLLTQIHRDLQRASDWYKPSEFVQSILQGADQPLIQEIARETDELVAHPNLFQMDDKTIDVCRRWDALCHRLFHVYQDMALDEIKRAEKGGGLKAA